MARERQLDSSTIHLSEECNAARKVYKNLHTLPYAEPTRIIFKYSKLNNVDKQICFGPEESWEFFWTLVNVSNYASSTFKFKVLSLDIFVRSVLQMFHST